MNFFKKIFVFLLTSFCMIVLMEFYFTQTEMIKSLNSELDEKLGFVSLPNQKFTFFNEGFCIGFVNSYGLLGREFPTDKRTDTFRIAVLGDSYVQALQVLDRDNFITKLQIELNKNTISEVEVLNFGVSGHNLSDMYYYSTNKAQTFKPNLLLFFLEQKDLWETPLSYKKNSLYPYIEVKNDSLKINYEFTKKKK